MSFQDYSSFKGIFKSSLFSSSQLLGSGFLSDHVGSSSEDEMNSLYGSNATSKKRRLSIQQVRCLESSFEEESKLEPEKKMQLAADLGLQPRQVAIWFQNRRARWKTKQLERDYDELKQNYDTLLSEKEELQLQVAGLTQELQELKGRQKEKEEMEVEIDYRSNATTSPLADKNDEEEEEEEEAQVKENAKGVSKTKTTRVTSEELQSLSPSFCSDTDSNPGNLRSSDTACHCHCHCHLSSTFDYLIMDHSESDWLATFP